MSSLPPEAFRPVLAALVTLERERLADTDRVAQLFECFCDRHEATLTWFANDDRGKIVPFRRQQREWPRTRLARPARTDAQWMAHDAVAMKGFPRSHFQACVRIRERSPHFAFCSVRPTSEDRDWLVARILELACAEPVFEGALGLAFPMSPRRDLDEQSQQQPLAMRFLGLDIPDPPAKSEVVRTVNWMTFVCDQLLDKAGGASKLQRELTDPIVWHRIRDGWVIQAGPDPVAGDVNQGDNVPLYRRVARALRPIRSTLYPLVSRDRAASAAWYQRFDGPDDDVAPAEPT